MEQDRKVIQFLKGSSILIIANVVLKAINFFLLPLYTDYLNPTELGITDLITTFTSFLFPILVMGLDSAFSAFFYEQKTEEHQKKVFNTIWFTLFLTSIIPLILIFFASRISYLLFDTTEHAWLVRIALFSISINLWYLPYSLTLRMQNKMAAFGFVNIVASITLIFSNILFLVIFNLSTYSLIISTFLSHLVQLILYIVILKESPSRNKIDNKLRKAMLKFAIPLVPTVVSAWALSMSDRFIIKMYLGEEAVGIYGIAARFAAVLAIISGSVHTAYSAFAFNKKDDADAKIQFKRVLNGFFFILLVICFTVSLFGKQIIILMTNKAYYSAFYILPGVLFGQLSYAVNTITGYGISFAKKTVYSLIATTAGALTSIVLNFLLIPRFGLVASGHVNFISYLIMCILAYYFSQKVYPCDYGIWKIFAIMLLSYFMVYISIDLNVYMKLIICFFNLLIICFLFKDVLLDYRLLAKEVTININKKKRKK
ncbi:MAG: oligosaccharide flippase family protein [Clostridiaceae bacterium]|nr:oligosaccharide flippase family protein [Clostridiaceae bacterium]